MEPDFQNKLRIQKRGRTAPCHVGLYQNLTVEVKKALGYKCPQKWGVRNHHPTLKGA